ncbi:MAG TPA: molybdopterin-dependent oxidoreductase [Thermodesulfobacteriota bacterium]|nr:molybdopterin-dependent oxidoreductase [Thermodesulfobacteriota bacterium]
MEEVVRTVCQSCHCECGVNVHVRDGKALSVEGDSDHPMSRGFICVKGRAEVERTYHPDRLKYPVRRVGGRGEGRWERVSWDMALDEIGQRLTKIREQHGPESIAAIHGTGPRPTLCLPLLAFALGTPNCISVDMHICFAPSMVAEHATIGHSIMMDNGPDYRNAKCIFIIGGNPVVSHPPKGVEILEAKQKRGTKLIVVDPRKTQLASQADLWLQIRPGTDGALVLGMLNTIITEELYDREFVEKWCHGFEELRDRVRDYPLDKVAEITWLPPDKIKEAAILYSTVKPAALHRRVAVDQNINSTQTARALINLVAITGNIDVKGGNLLPTPIEGYIPYVALTGKGKWIQPAPEILQKRIGKEEYPLISGPEAFFSFVPSVLAFEAMATGKPYPVKALYCAGGNPVVNVQKSKWVYDTLKKLDLLVVADFFMTPTAELADYVLPATTWLEREECCDLQHMNCASARQKAVEPCYECRDDLEIMLSLIQRIPWANRNLVPWKSTHECFEWLLKGTGLSFDEFKKKGYLSVAPAYRKYERSGFNTPSRKIELYSTIFHKYGYDPLPGYREPPESPVSAPGLAKDYPLILINGSRRIGYFCSEGRQIRRLREQSPDPLVEIHPDKAREMRIEDGEWVWIETPRGKGERVRFKAKLTKDIDPRVVHADYGWWFPEKPGPEHGCFESNINVVLSADPPREEICGSVPIKGTLCRIYK